MARLTGRILRDVPIDAGVIHIQIPPPKSSRVCKGEVCGRPAILAVQNSHILQTLKYLCSHLPTTLTQPDPTSPSPNPLPQTHSMTDLP